MLAIKILQDGNVRDVHGELHENIITICHEHRKANRALAFAFILFNYGHPNIKKMLDDKDYLRALHEKSGRYLTVFYIPQDEQFFGEDINNDRREVRHMAPLNSENQLAILLSSYMKTAEAIKLPAVLFFQVNGESISDWFVIGLDENKIEDSFVELYDYVKSAVSQLSEFMSNFET